MTSVIRGVTPGTPVSVEDAGSLMGRVGVSLETQTIGPRLFASVDAEHEFSEETEAMLPWPPLWLGDDGRGLYAPPAAGQIVVLGWVRGSRGHPYVAGYGGDRHQPPQAVPAGSLVLTDGRGGSITMAGAGAVEIAGGRGRIHVDDLIEVRNDAQNLRAVLVALIEAVIGLTTTGTAAAQAASPASQAALRAVRERVTGLLA